MWRYINDWRRLMKWLQFDRGKEEGNWLNKLPQQQGYPSLFLSLAVRWGYSIIMVYIWVFVAHAAYRGHRGPQTHCGLRLEWAAVDLHHMFYMLYSHIPRNTESIWLKQDSVNVPLLIETQFNLAEFLLSGFIFWEFKFYFVKLGLKSVICILGS